MFEIHGNGLLFFSRVLFLSLSSSCIHSGRKKNQHPLPTKQKLYNLRTHRVRVNDEIRQYRPDDPSSSAAVLPQPEVAAIPVKVANFFGEDYQKKKTFRVLIVYIFRTSISCRFKKKRKERSNLLLDQPERSPGKKKPLEKASSGAVERAVNGATAVLTTAIPPRETGTTTTLAIAIAIVAATATTTITATTTATRATAEIGGNPMNREQPAGNAKEKSSIRPDSCNNRVRTPLKTVKPKRNVRTETADEIDEANERILTLERIYTHTNNSTIPLSHT